MSVPPIRVLHVGRRSTVRKLEEKLKEYNVNGDSMSFDFHGPLTSLTDYRKIDRFFNDDLVYDQVLIEMSLLDLFYQTNNIQNVNEDAVVNFRYLLRDQNVIVFATVDEANKPNLKDFQNIGLYFNRQINGSNVYEFQTQRDGSRHELHANEWSDFKGNRLLGKLRSFVREKNSAFDDAAQRLEGLRTNYVQRQRDIEIRINRLRGNGTTNQANAVTLLRQKKDKIEKIIQKLNGEVQEYSNSARGLRSQLIDTQNLLDAEQEDYNKITADLEDILNEGFSENPKDLPILQTVTQLENDNKIQTESILETLADAIQDQNDQIDALTAQIESLENDDLGVSIVIGAYYNHVLEDIDEGGDDSESESDDGPPSDDDDSGSGSGSDEEFFDTSESALPEKTIASTPPIYVSRIPSTFTGFGTNNFRKHDIEDTNVEILFGLLYEEGDTDAQIKKKQESVIAALEFGKQDMESRLTKKSKILSFLANLRNNNLIEDFALLDKFSKRKGIFLTRKDDKMFLFYKLKEGYAMLARRENGQNRTSLISQEKARKAINNSDYIFNIKRLSSKEAATAFISAPGWAGAKNKRPSPFRESPPNDIFWQPATYGHNVLAEWEKVSDDKVIPTEGPVYAVNGDRYFTLTTDQILDTFDNHPVFLLPISPYFETNNNQRWDLKRFRPQAQGMVDITPTLFFREDVAEASITESEDGIVIMQIESGNMKKYNMNVSKTFEVVPHTGRETPLRVQFLNPVTKNTPFEITSTSAEVDPDNYVHDLDSDEKYFLVPAKEGDDNNATLTLLSTVLESRTTAAIGPESNPSSDENLEYICNMATSEEYCNFPCKYDMVNSRCNAMGQDSIYDYIINKADFLNKRLNKKMLRELINVALDNGLLRSIDEEKKKKVEMATRALYDHIKVGFKLENLGENDVFTSLTSGTRRIEFMLIAIAKALNSRKNSTARTLASKKLTYDTVTAVFGGALASVLLSLVADYFSNGQNFNGLCDYRENPGEIDSAKLPFSGRGGKFALDRLEYFTDDFCPGTTGGDDNYKINIYGGRENSVSVTGTNDNIRFDIKFETAPYGDNQNRGINVKEFQVDDFPREYETIFKFISETLNRKEEFLYQVHLGIIRSASNNDIGFILSNRDSDDILRQIINDALYETFTKAYFSGSVVHPDGLYSAKLRKGSDETPWGFFVDFTFKRENEGLYKEDISLIDLYKKVDFENESASNYYDKFDATDLVGEMFDNMVEAKDSGNEEKISVKDWKYHDPAEPWFIKNDEEIDFTLSGNNTATPRPVNLDIRVYGENVEIYYEYVKGSIGAGTFTFGGDTIKHYIILTQSELYKKAKAVFPGNFENNYDAVAGAGIIKELFKNFVFGKYPEAEYYHGRFRCYFYPQDCPEPQTSI